MWQLSFSPLIQRHWVSLLEVFPKTPGNRWDSYQILTYLSSYNDLLQERQRISNGVCSRCPSSSRICNWEGSWRNDIACWWLLHMLLLWQSKITPFWQVNLNQCAISYAKLLPATILNTPNLMKKQEGSVEPGSRALQLFLSDYITLASAHCESFLTGCDGQSRLFSSGQSGQDATNLQLRWFSKSVKSDCLKHSLWMPLCFKACSNSFSSRTTVNP